mgnify:CR=1 FL=1
MEDRDTCLIPLDKVPAQSKLVRRIKDQEKLFSTAVNLSVAHEHSTRHGRGGTQHFQCAKCIEQTEVANGQELPAI